MCWMFQRLKEKHKQRQKKKTETKILKLKNKLTCKQTVRQTDFEPCPAILVSSKDLHQLRSPVALKYSYA